MKQETLDKIVDGAANIVHTPYLKAEISNVNESGLSITTEYNCNNKREAAAMVACLAAEIIDNQSDMNKLFTIIRKQVKYERK